MEGVPNEARSYLTGANIGEGNLDSRGGGTLVSSAEQPTLKDYENIFGIPCLTRPLHARVKNPAHLCPPQVPRAATFASIDSVESATTGEHFPQPVVRSSPVTDADLNGT